MNLTLEQEAVVECRDRRRLVLAGPGSGKTSTLSACIARDVEHGIPIEAIAAVTFTQRAAESLKQRLKGIAATRRGLYYVGTVHGLCLGVLRRAAQRDGHQQPSVLGDQQARELAFRFARRLGAKLTAPEAAAIVESKAPDPALTPGSVHDAITLLFHQHCRKAALLSFEQLRLNALAELRRNPPPIASLYWDEVQDADQTDWDLMEACDAGRVMAVGDPNQSIYRFRGAQPEVMRRNIASGSWTILAMTTNFRSGPAVCGLANSIMSASPQRVAAAATVPSANASLGLALITPCGSVAEEQFIAIEFARQAAAAGATCALLARTRAEANNIRDALLKAGLSLAPDHGDRPKRPVGWDLIVLLNVVRLNPWSEEDAAAYLERRYGPTAADRFRLNCARDGKALSSIVLGDATNPPIALDALAIRESVPSAAVDLLRRLGDDWSAEPPDQDVPDESVAAAVMTAHAAKGLEWDRVMVTGVEEGMFPTARAGTDLEEERRLLYVAATRALHVIQLTWCRMRPQNRGPNLPPGPATKREPSRFITHLNP